MNALSKTLTFDDHLDDLAEILTKQQNRPVSLEEAAFIGRTLIEFFEVLGEENKIDEQRV